jgi:hypothetical protein
MIPNGGKESQSQTARKLRLAFVFLSGDKTAALNVKSQQQLLAIRRSDLFESLPSNRLFETLRYPHLYDRLSRHAQAFRFFVQQLDHP